MIHTALRKFLHRFTLFSTVALMAAGGVATSRADVVMTNGSLSVTIRGNNGAIDTVKFGGSDFFNPGSPVSDFGLQSNGNTSTFGINTTTGVTNISVSVASVGGNAVVTGTYTGGGANLDISRTYSLVAGSDVLRVSTTLTNNGAAGSFQLFDTFDPDQGDDQGTSLATYNDVFALGGGTVGQATESDGLTVIGGTLDPNGVVAAGYPFNIGNGFSLNSFLAAPFDGNGAFDDEGLHLGINQLLAAGGSATFVYDLAFGLNPEAAQDQFVQANTPVPEPTSLALWGLATAAGAGWMRRKRVKA